MELSEDEIYATLRAGYEAVREVRPLLMICHTPPYDTKCDRIMSGRSVGSTAARRFIEEVKPEVCISGHIHESAGVDQIGAAAQYVYEAVLDAARPYMTRTGEFP